MHLTRVELDFYFQLCIRQILVKSTFLFNFLLN